MTCRVENCPRRIYYKAGLLCNMHYQRLKKHGDPQMGRTPNGEPQLFFNKTVLTFTGEDCLIWPYARDNHGYARMFDGKRMKSVSRMVCEKINGPSTVDKPHAAHSCGKGLMACVSPKHLRWASVSENMKDRTLHNTDNRGERCATSKLNEREVRQIRSLNGVTQTFLADLYGVDVSTVSNIISRKRWSWLE
jgi:hypothetical protein